MDFEQVQQNIFVV